MGELDSVYRAIYACILIVGGISLSYYALWKVLKWSIEGPDPHLGHFEGLLPVRGRWVKYLLGPPLVIAAPNAVIACACFLWRVPATVGLVLLLTSVALTTGFRALRRERPSR